MNRSRLVLLLLASALVAGASACSVGARSGRRAVDRPYASGDASSPACPTPPKANSRIFIPGSA